MRLTFEQLKAKMPEITALLFSHPAIQDHSATEIYIKFKNSGVYACINFEEPLPTKINLEKLVGAGDAINRSEAKRDSFNQYDNMQDITDILKKSYNFKYNMKDTVIKVEELFNAFKGNSLFS